MDGELRRLFRHHLRRVLWSPLESGLTDPGVPDINGLYNSVEFWVETKRTDCNSVSIRSSQVAWHKLRTSRGSRTFFAIRKTKRKPKPVDELYIVHGRYVRELHEGGLLGVPVAYWAPGGPAKWDWHAVLDIFVT